MIVLRKSIDNIYLLLKPIIFFFTKNDPTVAHDRIIKLLNLIQKLRLTRILFKRSFSQSCHFVISTAAGFDKNADIPFFTLECIGFDRLVFGTVCAKAWKGNPKPNCFRIPESSSIINSLGLPGQGTIEVEKNLLKQKNYHLPVTLNFTLSPAVTSKDEIIDDIKTTLLTFSKYKNIDRFELNLSCPNIEKGGIWHNILDKNNQEYLLQILDFISNHLQPHQSLYLKISPQLNTMQLDYLLSICEHPIIAGITACNTTTEYDRKLIPKRYDRGGASGNAVYQQALQVQTYLSNNKQKDLNIIACGGINSVEKLHILKSLKIKEIQLYTPFIYGGTKLITQLKKTC